MQANRCQGRDLDDQRSSLREFSDQLFSHSSAVDPLEGNAENARYPPLGTAVDNYILLSLSDVIRE